MTRTYHCAKRSWQMLTDDEGELLVREFAIRDCLEDGESYCRADDELSLSPEVAAEAAKIRADWTVTDYIARAAWAFSIPVEFQVVQRKVRLMCR